MDSEWRKSREYRIWRAHVVRRDKRCVICGNIEGREAHHMNHATYFPEERFDDDNGVCLCKKCHMNFHCNYKNSYREKCTKTDFENFKVLFKYIFNLATPAKKIVGWDDFFMNMCDIVAMKSKDPSTKIGAVIVSDDHRVKSLGYNGFPMGAVDNITKVPNRYERPLKYLWTEHAERNAIYNAGTIVSGCTIYINNLSPCCDCARAIIQTGIKEVVISDKPIPERWLESCGVALDMLKECGVKVRRIKVKGKGGII